MIRDSECIWAEDENGAFDSSCGGKFEFADDGPKANGFKFCPYCGKKLVEHEVKP